MRHVCQEQALHLSRLSGALRLHAQLILLTHQVVDVSPYAEGTQQFSVLVVFRDTVDLHPLVLRGALRHHRMHLSDIYQRLLHLLQVERAHHGVQTIIELQNVSFQTDAPRLHPRCLQHIAQLRLVVPDGLIHLLHPDIVLHHVEIHVAFFRHVVSCHGDIHQLPFIIVDGVYADFQIHAHVSLRNDTQRAGPVVFRMHMIQHLVEGRYIKEIHLREELVARIAVEVTDLTHDAVGIYKPAVGGVERHTDNGVLEDRPVSF